MGLSDFNYRSSLYNKEMEFFIESDESVNDLNLVFLKNKALGLAYLMYVMRCFPLCSRGSEPAIFNSKIQKRP